ncbi:MAG: replication-associated recombination protein A [Caldiserica bacterium]|nr:replication-associated recombination protein A [Caldisericota bacterium]
MEDTQRILQGFEPSSLDEFVGQAAIAGPGTPLRKFVSDHVPFSAIIWGPPGCGKTTFARLVAKDLGEEMEYVTAVSAGLPELRQVVARHVGRPFLLVVDEVHRFNRIQQDFLLPMLENRLMTFVGLTTESPYAALSPALRSRIFMLRFSPLTTAEITRVLTKGCEKAGIQVSGTVLNRVAAFSSGDARVAVNALVWLYQSGSLIEGADLSELLKEVPVAKNFEQEHYDLASAFIKSMRGSDPDAALYYLARMIDAGDDPLFVARRMIIFAAEDVGLANPFAIVMATAAYDAVHAVGLPEAMLNLTEVVIYLAGSPKNNSVLGAMRRARDLAQQTKNVDTPIQLKNSRTGQALYKYPHSFPGNWVAQEYFPDEVHDRAVYLPTGAGYEHVIIGYLKSLRAKKPE